MESIKRKMIINMELLNMAICNKVIAYNCNITTILSTYAFMQFFSGKSNTKQYFIQFYLIR